MCRQDYYDAYYYEMDIIERELEDGLISVEDYNRYATNLENNLQCDLDELEE